MSKIIIESILIFQKPAGIQISSEFIKENLTRENSLLFLPIILAFHDPEIVQIFSEFTLENEILNENEKAKYLEIY